MLNIEVIRFEAQDVITASVACICGGGKCDPEDHSFYSEKEGKVVYCPASVHVGCPKERYE